MIKGGALLKTSVHCKKSWRTIEKAGTLLKILVYYWKSHRTVRKVCALLKILMHYWKSWCFTGYFGALSEISVIY
jgi:hypothetical protein